MLGEHLAHFSRFLRSRVAELGTSGPREAATSGLSLELFFGSGCQKLDLFFDGGVVDFQSLGIGSQLWIYIYAAPMV